MNEQMQRLSVPFEPRYITWKPGSTTRDKKKCLAMAYADTRAYQERLDEVFGWDWQTTVQVISGKQVLSTVTLEIDGRLVSRSATAEDTDLMSAEARAFKRACSAFGLGRYLYDLPSVWVEYDEQRQRIAEDGQASLDKRYQVWYAQHTPQTRQEAPQRTQTPTRGELIAALHDGPKQDSTLPTATAGETFGDDSSTPWYVTAKAQLTNGVANFAEAALGYQRTGEPASEQQYQYLSGLLNSIVRDATGADDGHKRVLAVLCQSDISSSNPPSKTLASNLLDKLATHKRENGEKIANPSYDHKVVDACVTIYRTAEAVATPMLLQAA